MKNPFLNTNRNNSIHYRKSVLIPRYNLYLALSQNCNLRCRYCCTNFGRFGNKIFSSMSKKIAKRAVQFILRCIIENNILLPNQKNILPISFIGGEVLLNFPMVKYLVNYTQNKSRELGISLSFTVNTNGTLISKEIAQFLVDNQFIVAFSIDGKKCVHDRYRIYANGKGSYTNVIKGLRLYESVAKEPLHVQATITKGKDLKKSVLHLWQLGFPMVIANPIIEVGFSPEKFKFNGMDQNDYLNQYFELCEISVKKLLNQKEVKFLKQFYKYLKLIHQDSPNPNKQIIVTTICVASDGKLYPSEMLINHKDYQIGDVFMGLDCKALEQYRQRHKRLIQKCCSCWANNICSVPTQTGLILIEEKNSREMFEVRCKLNNEIIMMTVYFHNMINNIDKHVLNFLFLSNTLKNYEFQANAIRN